MIVAEKSTIETKSQKSKVSWPPLAVSQEKDPKTRDMLRQMMRCIDDWNLIEAGDKIMVALSGGKDSYTLFELLNIAVQRAPFDVEIIGVHLDQEQPGYAPALFYKWLEDYGAPFEIIKYDTYSVVQEKIRPNQAACVICSRMRRGLLYTAAERLGCNKIALGHHRDDSIETFMMNFFFAGKLQAMPASYKTNDKKFDVIRPMINMAEDDIRDFAKERNYPIIPCNLCGSQDGLKRDEMKRMLIDLTNKYPNIRSVMHNAIGNVRPSHLLDPDVQKVWDTRDADIRPDEVAKVKVKQTPYRYEADIVKSHPLLQILN